VEVHEVIEAADSGKAPAVCVLVGSERLWIDRAVDSLRAACAREGTPGFNDDVLEGKGLSGDSVLGLVRTLPMLAPRRFVLVRHCDAMSGGELDRLVDYLKEPAPETCLVMTAAKLDGRGRFAKAARKARTVVEVKSPKPGQVGGFVRQEARRRGHPLDREGADALVDAIGANLDELDDALERLSLYVGESQPITAAAVADCVTHVKAENIFTLVDAVGNNDTELALATVANLLANRQAALGILAMLSRQLRILARMRSALASGLQPREAAQRAGAPPFKARDLARAAGHFPRQRLERAFGLLAETDVALKGSRVPDSLVLERAVLELCQR